MEVEILTINGHVLVELDAYLPASVSKVRKLFRLMRSGLTRQDKLAVRAYLRERIQNSNASEKELKSRRTELEAELTKLDLAYMELVQQRKETRGELTSVKGQIREIGKVTDSGPSWLRMFDEICMGADRRMEDLSEEENRNGED